jgi:diaminohydroxyphosphoribosylaminopyrimidine deaminase / 5-amino-6-(5-phosphoribosylamino)uracil reductase
MSIDTLEQACMDLKQALSQTTSMPYLTMSLALTMNGVISGLKGTPLKISGELSDQFIHFARSEHDAIVVSANTVQSDNPLLNVRHVQGRSPDVIILDRNMKSSPSSRLFEVQSRRVHILSASDHVQIDGANIHKIRCHRDEIDLASVHYWAKEMGYRSLFIEAGPRLFSSFLKYSVHRVILSIAPKFDVGLNIYDSPGQMSFSTLGYKQDFVYSIGEDLLITYKSKETQ